MASTEPKSAGMKPLLKGILYLLGVVLILLIIIQLFLSFFADDYAGNYLKDSIRESSNNTYIIDFDDLSLNVFSGSVNITNLNIEADTTAFASKTTPVSPPPKSLFQGTVGNIDISGVSVFSTIWGEELKIGSITITKPDIKQFRNPHQFPVDSSSQFSTVDSSIYAAISNRYRALEIDKFTIHNGTGIALQSTDTLASLHGINLALQNIRVDSVSARSGRQFITNDISLETGPFTMPISNNFSTISFGNLDISSDDQTVRIDSFRLDPRYPRLEYSRKKGQKTDRIELRVPVIKFEAVDFGRLVNDGRIYAGYGEINNAHFEDLMNKSVPPGPIESRELPFTAFRDLKQLIKIDSLRINNAYLSYSEYLNKAPQAGTVTFEQLNAIFYDISNYAQDIANGLTTSLDVQTHVYGTGQLNVHFEFPMDTKNGFHKIEGKLNSMSITPFNRMAKYIAFVRVDKGVLNSLEFNMTLDENRSNGDAIMNYENLEVSVLDAKTMEQRGIKENIITFVANNFVVNKNNTPESGMQAGRIQFERVKHKSIFNYWWKSLLSGIKNSVK